MVKSAVRYIQRYIFIRYNWSLYPIFTIVPINCPQKRIRVKLRDHSRQDINRLELEEERYVCSHVEITQDVSSNTNNFFNDLFVIYSNCYPIKEKEISFARLRKPWISDAIMISLNRKHELLFDSIRMELLPLIIIIPSRIISPLLHVLLKIAISRENSPSALITLGTRGKLYTVWFGLRKRVKMWPWTTMAPRSVTPQ